MHNYKIQNDAIDYTQRHDSLISNCYFSLRIKRGKWFFNPDFGCRWFTIKKITSENIRLIIQYAEEALKWLVDCGRLQAIDVEAWRDEANLNRCVVFIKCRTSNDMVVTFETFFQVI